MERSIAYEGRPSVKFTTSVALQPYGSYHATISQMKDIYVLFHLQYGRFMCSKRLQNERPKCEGMVVDPRAFQDHAEIGLFELGLNYTYLLENFKIFVSTDRS